LVRLTRAVDFSASLRCARPDLSEDENRALFGRAASPHGHNYRLEVTVAGDVDPVTGMSVDLGLVDTAVKAALLDRVDHYDLSATVPELAGVITTGEGLARVFWQWLEPALPPGRLRRLAVVETDSNAFEYGGETDTGEVTPR